MTDTTTTTPNQQAVLYQATGLGRSFRTGAGEVRALDGIDLEIRTGELVAIEGPSGSGKSTLLQLLGALDRPTSGTLTFDGSPLGDLGERARTAVRARQVGFVFQGFNLIPTLTAAENVETAMAPLAVPRRERQARCTELLTRVGLGERSTHIPTRLSGGEQQRVAIARALANEPRVILADEPTGNLDSVTSEEIMSILEGLSRDQGVTVVIITHEEAVAARAQRRIRLRDGKVQTE